ncbi:lysozyme inhibitor LprI family protein [Azorhizobium doebereinerae]|uniref:lysozyme inhibitor LprI family protein n=1 Tax=Azorhizobium doebereinerae TaxID=281091 RepID=UPI000427ED34|nr:lysozyme inhibitor LprI family protein [Azorhizobium doebereinerae]
MVRRRRSFPDGPAWGWAALLACCLLSGPAAAQQGPWREPNPCAAGKLPAPDYSRCLFEATQASERAVTAAFEAAMAVVEGRADLPSVQRNRWKSQLDEAQTRFVLFRNLDCQSVAPFEGPRGIGNFEQRALCLIENNSRRERDLAARYPRPKTPVAVAAQGGETLSPHPATWTVPGGPRLD